MTEETQITGGFPPPPLFPNTMRMVQALGTGMDRTEERQGGQRIDDQLVVKGWELLDKGNEKGINAPCFSPDFHSPFLLP